MAEVFHPHVVAHEAVRSAEGGHRAVVVAGQRREGREVDAGRPALGQRRDLRDRLVGGGEPGAPQEQARLLARQPKVVDTDLDQPPAPAQPGERNRRLRPARDREAAFRRQLVDEAADDLEALRWT